MRRLLWGVLVFLMVFSATSVLAINQELGTVKLQQPNGVKFTVRRFVDEFGLFDVTQEGYVVKNEKDGFYYYGEFDPKGHLSPSAFKLGIDELSSRRSIEKLAAENERRWTEYVRRWQGWDKERVAKTAKTTVTMPDSLIVILVEFSDVKHQNTTDWPMAGVSGSKDDYGVYTKAEFEDMLFSDGGYTTTPDGQTAYGSLRDYYEDMSDDDFVLKGRVANSTANGIPNWVTLPNTKASYNNGSHFAFVSAALDSAESQQGIDISTNDTRK